jgi:putative Holliday junction resolvase
MKKVLGIDFGNKRIGLAISDLFRSISLPIETVEAKKTLPETVSYLEEFLKERLPTIDTIVIGLPLHLDGKDSEMSLKCREFAKLIEEKLKIKVALVDERLSSTQMDNDFKSMGFKRKKRTKLLDSASACLLLRTYLDTF